MSDARRRALEAPSFLQTLGDAWEGVPGWRPCLRALDQLANAWPAADARGVVSRSGRTTYPDSDVISTSELMAFMAIDQMADCRPIWVGPSQLLALPPWPEEHEKLLSPAAAQYSKELRLPFDRVFLDFTDASGNPAILPHVFDGEDGEKANASLYGALVLSPGVAPNWIEAGQGTIIVPFGAMMLVDGFKCMPVHSDYQGRTFTPEPAPMGYVQFGLPSSREPMIFMGDVHPEGASPGPRPMLALTHVLPISMRDSDYWAYAVVGTGAMTKQTLDSNPDLRLGAYPFMESHASWGEVLAQTTVVAYQASEALKALYLLESVNIELSQAPVSRQVRRRVERSGDRRIAMVVEIKTRQRRYAREGKARAGKREFSHSFDRRGHYNHVTRGRHVRNPDKMAPCPEWQQRHPHSELCRREYVPPAVVDAGPDKPYIPKSREVS